MKEFVKPAQVLLDLDCTTKDEVLSLLSDKALELGITDDRDAVKAAFDAREEEGSTGMMDGFSVPHAKTDAIKDAAVIVTRFVAPIADWESIDGTEITVGIALLVPDAEAGSTHIALLAQIARALMDEGFREVIRTATEPSQVSELINDRLAG
ncbi:MAG: PTS sugar transporter subunit IIA [Collinsella intestinalis]|nr:PTS sugar transporter subunit IIA [Collinsella intestinalis]